MSATVIPKPAVVPLEDVSDPRRSGRIECYLHSDAITANKGGAMVKVVCDTDFAARTNEFYLFARTAARMAYACSANVWADVVTAYPHMADELQKVRNVLKEEVTVTEIVTMKI